MEQGLATICKLLAIYNLRIMAFNLFRPNQTLDFSDSNFEQLSKSISNLQETLATAHFFDPYVPYLDQVLNTARIKDSETFKKLVVSNELFGGSGALWEIYINDSSLDKRFKTYFTAFIESIEKIGINNKRIRQVKSGMK